MRFRRWPRPTSYEDTPRKRAVFLRKQHRECEFLPLFASIVQSDQQLRFGVRLDPAAGAGRRSAAGGGAPP